MDEKNYKKIKKEDASSLTQDLIDLQFHLFNRDLKPPSGKKWKSYKGQDEHPIKLWGCSTFEV